MAERMPAERPTSGDAASAAVGPSSAPAVGLISSATEESGDRTDDSTSGRGRLRRATPIIAVGATACAVIALVVLGLDRLNQPQPVARLVALEEVPRGTALPMVDPADLQTWGVTDPDFVPYEEYGALDVWSTTAARGRQCLAVSIGGEVYGFHCTAPNIDTFVDILGLNSWMPEAPGGGRIPSESTIRFVLHDDVVDVYLGPIRNTVG